VGGREIGVSESRGSGGVLSQAVKIDHLSMEPFISQGFRKKTRRGQCPSPCIARTYATDP